MKFKIKHQANKILFFVSLILCIINHHTIFSQNYSAKPFNSLTYNAENFERSDASNEAIQKFEQSYLKKQRLFFSEIQFEKELVFHNHTTMSTAQFTQQVEFQLRALNDHFTMNENTYKKVFRSDDQSNSKSEIIKFTTNNRTYWSRQQPTQNEFGWQDVKIGKTTSDEKIHIWVTESASDIYGRGYAQFPWIEDKAFSGIVIHRPYFGTGNQLYDEGKTMVYLMGNYFGLFALSGNGSCIDDQVHDTPIHNTKITDCLDPSLSIRSTCDNKLLLLDNFMIESPDACKNSFTPGQWKRMLHTINTFN